MQIMNIFAIQEDERCKKPRFYVLHGIYAPVSLSILKQNKKVREILNH